MSNDRIRAEDGNAAQLGASRVVATPVALLLAVLSIAMLVRGVRSGDAVVFVCWILVGGVLGAIALYLLAGMIAEVTANWSRKQRLVVGGLLVTCGVAGTALVVALFEERWWSIYLAPGGLIGAMVGLLFLLDDLGQGDGGKADRLLTGGLVLNALPLVVALVTKPSAGGWAVLIAVWTIGLTAVKLGITPWMIRGRSSNSQRALGVLIASVVAVAAAMILLNVSTAAWALVTAGWLLIVGLSTGGLASIAIELNRLRWPVVGVAAVAGVGALAMGGMQLALLIPAWIVLGSIVGVFSATLGAFFVFRGEGVVALVLFGALLAWVLVDRVEDPYTPEQSLGTVLVLGDSFMAGQGAEAFIADTNSRADGANMCRRSPVSFARLVATEFNRSVADYACNGAETDQLRRLERSGSSDRVASDGDSQLYDVLNEPFGVEDLGSVDLVLVTAGGNDAEFSTVVISCFLPTSCEDEGRSFLRLAEVTKDDLVATYDAIAAAFGDEPPPIVVVPYPSYVGVEACGRAFDEIEVAFANVFIATMNETILAATNEAGAGVHYFDEIDRAYAGRTLCESEPAANFVNLLPPEGPILERLMPIRWHEGSAHPNEMGHRCTAVVLAGWLDDRGLLPAADRSGPGSTCEIDDAALTKLRVDIDAMVAAVDLERDGPEWRTPLDADVCRGPCDASASEPNAPRHVCHADGCLSVETWAGERSRAFFSDLLWPLSLTLAGGLLLAFCFVSAAPKRWLDLFPFVPSQARSSR